jgi:non-homologous end joining protein Ku
MELIAKKDAGQEIVAQPGVEAPARVEDLMAALEASVQAARDKRASDKKK